MIIVDFECQNEECGKIEMDALIDSSEWERTCPWCGAKSKRIIAIGRINTANDDAPHIRESAKALLDPDTAIHSDKAHVRELARDPTRANLIRYLKAEGLRYAENERGAPPVYKPKPPVDTTKAKKEAYEQYRKDKAITVNTSGN